MEQCEREYKRMEEGENLIEGKNKVEREIVGNIEEQIH